MFPSTHGNYFPRDLIMTFVHKQLDYWLCLKSFFFFYQNIVDINYLNKVKKKKEKTIIIINDKTQKS